MTSFEPVGSIGRPWCHRRSSRRARATRSGPLAAARVLRCPANVEPAVVTRLEEIGSGIFLIPVKNLREEKRDPAKTWQVMKKYDWFNFWTIACSTLPQFKFWCTLKFVTISSTHFKRQRTAKTSYVQTVWHRPILFRSISSRSVRCLVGRKIAHT